MKVDTKISSIAENTFIKGEIVSEGEIHLSGNVEGNINAKTLYVAKGGKLTGSVVVDNLTVSGHIEGDVVAEKAFFKKTGKIKGEIKYRILAVEEGAELLAVLKKLDGELGLQDSIENVESSPNTLQDNPFSKKK